MGTIHVHQPRPNLRVYRVTDDKGWEEEVETNEPDMDTAVMFARGMADANYAEYEPPDEPIPLSITVTDSVTNESTTVSHTVDSS